MTTRRRKISHIVAALLLAGLHPAQAQEGDASPLRLRYGDIGRQPAHVADTMLAQDLDSISAQRAITDLEIQTSIGPRIANGADVVLGNFPEVARIEFSDARGDHICTGVLLSTDAILTAGHCGCGSKYRAEIQYRPVETSPESAFAPFEVSGGPILFPGYDCRDPGRTQAGRDLALLRIVPFSYGSGVAVITWADRRLPLRFNFPVIRSTVQVLSQEDLRSLYIVGFGATESGSLTRNLQGANVGLISRNCRRGRVFLSICAMFREFALGRTSSDPGSKPVDSCGGDSGGPAYRMDTDAKVAVDGQTIDDVSQRTLVGIVSRALSGVAHPYPGYCGGGGIYTAVGTRPVLDWLRSQNVQFSFDTIPLYQPDAG